MKHEQHDTQHGDKSFLNQRGALAPTTIYPQEAEVKHERAAQSHQQQHQQTCRICGHRITRAAHVSRMGHAHVSCWAEAQMTYDEEGHPFMYAGGKR